MIIRCYNPVCRGVMYPDEDAIKRCSMCGRTNEQSMARVETKLKHPSQRLACPDCGVKPVAHIKIPSMWLANHRKHCRLRAVRETKTIDNYVNADCR